jgi:tetratricopeptide (TPR) repeat protein
MDTEGIPGRAIAMVVIAFLFLAGLQLWWQTRDGQSEEKTMVVDSARVDTPERELQLDADDLTERERNRKREMQRQLRILARSEDRAERRSAALRLQYLADETAEDQLLQLLKSEDKIVARRCAEALVGIWQESGSPSVDRLMSRGIAAYENGNYQEAAARFEMCAELDSEIPDLHRLRASVMLKRGQTREAIDACEEALSMENRNYLAHYILARAYRRQSEGDAALEEVEQALDIYPGYEPARQLRAEILSLQKAGEL